MNYDCELDLAMTEETSATSPEKSTFSFDPKYTDALNKAEVFVSRGVVVAHIHGG